MCPAATLRYVQAAERVCVVTLCFAVLACSHDGGTGPNPPPPPPPAPTVATVTSTPGPSQLLVQNDILYWLDSSSAPFKRLSLASGATPIALFQESPVPENELSDGSYVYWVSGARLFRSTLDGTITTRLDSADGPAPAVMALDESSIYWLGTVPSSCSPPCRFAIRRVPKSGGTATTVATTADGVVDLTALAVARGFVFWEEGGVGPAALDGSVGSKILRVSLANGTVTTVVDGMENGLIVLPGPGFIPASWHPRGGIVADTDSVYFADADFFQSYRVMSVAVNGGPINILLADTTYDMNDFVRSMTSDATTLYWVDLNQVRSMAKTGGPVTNLAGPRTIPPWSVTRVGSNLYWIEAPCCAHGDKGTIHTVPITGGTPVIVQDNLDSPSSIASDPGHVFWIEGGAGIGAIEGFASLRSSALGGGNARTLIETTAGGPFAADANAIYWADKWTIKRVPLAGGPPQRIATGDFYIQEVATDGVNVYWVENQPYSIVRSVSVNGGAVTTLGAGPGPAGRIRVQDNYVYWLAHDDEIDRVPKVGGTPIRLVGPIPGLATDFALDANSLYISGWDSGTIWKAPLAGGTLTSLASPGLDQTRRIEADGGKVYWIDQRYVTSLTADGHTLVTIHSGVLSDAFSHNGLAFDSQSVFWTEVADDAILKATPK